ncbi:MAG: hypothetical protein ACOH2F_07920 [Cellulomonas sp.]
MGIVAFGLGQLTLAGASASVPADAPQTPAPSSVLVPGPAAPVAATAADPVVAPAAAPAAAPVAATVALALPRELRFDTVADAAVQVAVLDTRIAVLDQALTRADAASSAAVGKVDATVLAPLADAAVMLRSLRDQRTHPGIPAATAAAVRLTGPVVAATAAFDVEQARLAAVAAEDARLAEVRAAASAAAAVVGGAGSGATTAGAGSGSDVAAIGEATLRTLPGNAGVHLAWNHPAIGTHLGGVFLDQVTEIMINGRRLAATPGRTSSVVMHEIGHIYQARIIAAEAPARGGWSASSGALMSRLNAIFGGNGQERSADCVALAAGATWTAYTTDCNTPARQAAVHALRTLHFP